MNNWLIEIEEDIRTLSDAELKEVGRLLSTNMVVVFKKPVYGLTPEEQLEIVHSIGRTPPLPEDEELRNRAMERGKNIMIVPGVLRVTGKKNENGQPGLFGHVSELDWHANQASNKERSPIVWMYGVEGMKGSRTSFINMIEVYENLPQELKDRIKDKKCYFGYKKGTYSSSPYFHEHVNKENLFDLVMTTVSGKTGLYFPFNQVFGMADTKDGEFEMLKDELMDYILDERFVYHHDWVEGQILLSDQWLSIHKRWEFDKMEERLLHRIAFDYSEIYESYP